jgi:hypothetical protein
MADPIPFRPPVLTLHALDTAQNWEAVLSLPLPDNPGFDLLQRSRDEVLSYLVWLFNDVAQGAGLPHVRREIICAANRLAEIAAHWPEALSRHLDQQLADEEAGADMAGLVPGALFNILCPGRAVIIQGDK